MKKNQLIKEIKYFSYSISMNESQTYDKITYQSLFIKYCAFGFDALNNYTLKRFSYMGFCNCTKLICCIESDYNILTLFILLIIGSKKVDYAKMLELS
jgi:hypothetical protein